MHILTLVDHPDVMLFLRISMGKFIGRLFDYSSLNLESLRQLKCNFLKKDCPSDNAVNLSLRPNSGHTLALRQRLQYTRNTTSQAQDEPLHLLETCAT